MTNSLLFFLAMAAQDPDLGRQAEPRGNPGSWVGSNDYPVEALESRTEGSTGFTLKIDPDGKVLSCSITETSGSTILDQRTCEVLQANAQFRPALDEKGKPVQGEWSSAVRWTLPEPFTLPFHDERTRKITLIQEANGEISSCTVEGLDNPSEEITICNSALAEQVWPKGYAYGAGRKKIVFTFTETTDISVVED
ncbi:MAG: energy transducer TonB [Pseudomonadota bacterium]